MTAEYVPWSLLRDHPVVLVGETQHVVFSLPWVAAASAADVLVTAQLVSWLIVDRHRTDK
jgi:hypothetical protein